MTNIIIKIKNRFLKTTSDFLYSILASVVTTGMLQLLVYPSLAKYLDAQEYGLLLTVMGLINTIGVSLGNTLNNTRLIQDTEYNEKNIKGDFNFLLTVSNIIGLIFTTILALFLYKNIITIIALMTLIVLLITRAYLVVTFIIKLDFKKYFICNIISVIGYVIGLFFVKYSGVWPLVFIFSEAISIVYILFTSDIKKDPLKRTPLFKKTYNKYLMLIMTGLIANLLVYLDRLLIYPILKGEAVAIYTTASLFGKCLGILMTPVSSVLLGYYSKKEFSMNSKKFWGINFIVLVISFSYIIVAIFFGPWITGILYPTLIESAKPYMLYANIGSIIGVTTIMIQPALLKFAPTYWQVIKEVSYGLLYIVLGLFSIKFYGLLGFCITAIIVNCYKLILMYIIGYIYIKKCDKRG